MSATVLGRKNVGGYRSGMKGSVKSFVVTSGNRGGFGGRGYIDTSRMVVESHRGRRRWREVEEESLRAIMRARRVVICVKEERV